ncbi:uncharacterized protein APUU_70492A [Aspergillus puulaauensis]|uniref:Uncharacterized protein n=1 Tax=Aspergillus puulaauensis TaxID=1220207 RepID=A0A7R7XWU3_9EURO|nr:uncharacterized protein APUU_70492A [Aspergillus puulaauensis]BCS28922.1 hypothetical protein APUU_70492A [Aspergillus puulaauensis]
MASESGLGNFSVLSYDIRNLIWSKVSNTEPSSPKQGCLNVYTNLLRASKGMYNEINEFLFSGCVLEILLAPISIPLFKISLGHLPAQPLSHSPVRQGRVQIPINTLHPESLSLFPFHILDQVVVRLVSPCALERVGVFYIWKNTQTTVNVLKSAGTLGRLTLSFQGGHLNFNSSYKPSFDGFDHNFFVRPFNHLRQVATIIKVTTDTEVAASAMDLATTNRTLSKKNELWSEREFQLELAKDWYNVCLLAGTPGQGWSNSLKTLQQLHQEILVEWLKETPSGELEFIKQFNWIWTNCREVIWELDPSLSLFTKARNALKYRDWVTHQHGAVGTSIRKSAVMLDDLAEAIEIALVACWNFKHGQRSIQENSKEGSQQPQLICIRQR